MNPVLQVYQTSIRVQMERQPSRLRSRLRLKWYAQPVLDWILRRLNRLITKLQCVEPFEESRISFTPVKVEPDRIGRAITEHVHSFLCQRGEMPGIVLVGRDHFHGLSEECMREFQFNVDLRYRQCRSMPFGIEVMEYSGVKVMCVPWMQGILAMPELDPAKKQQPRRYFEPDRL